MPYKSNACPCPMCGGPKTCVSVHCRKCSYVLQRSRRRNPDCICRCGCGGTTSDGTHLFIKGHSKIRRNFPADRYEVDPETGCWNWTGAILKTGYGAMSWLGKNKPAHRIAYEQFVGPIPDGLVLDHLCRNTRCVNPDHLEPVTSTENIRRGTCTKLTKEDVKQIRELAVSMSFAEIGRKFGVTGENISYIVRQKTWTADLT